MCGIAGCVVGDGRTPGRDALEALAAALGHRGPDDAGIEVVGNVGLVHARLAIVDPSPAGHEPMHHPERGWWLTYNGEIFNHAGLREELPAHAYRGGSDAETLLHALATWGEGALQRLNGLFAFAALDPASNRLLLVRDRFGVKPLYYARHDGGLWFASEIGALLRAGVPRRARPDVLLHAVRHGWANGELTPVEGVQRLLPGHSLSVDLATLELTERVWYRPADVVDQERMAALEDLDAASIDGRVEAALRASVHARLMADVPVGTMCSGGLDSSLITALAAEGKPDLLAFNASVSDEPAADEGPWAKLVADALGVELCTVPMDAESWRRDLVGVVGHVEYPLNHESSVPMWQIADLARRRGCKVLLSGEGADELFGGYPWASPRLTRRFQLRRRPMGRAARELVWALRDRRVSKVGGTDAPGGESDRVLEFEREALESARDAYGHHRGTRRELEAHMMALLSSYLPHLLNRQDKTTMKASIETREPFLDPELVALTLNLPLEARVGSQPKAVLRRIAGRLLPEEIGRREKVGFGFDYRRYLLSDARPEFLLDGRLRELHSIPAERWRELAANAGWPLPLWTGEIWARLALAGDSVERVERELWRSHG